MARVFSQKKTFLDRAKPVLAIIIVVLIIIGVWYTAESLGRSQDREGLRAVKDAVVQATVQCYALEGRYPEGLDYLKEHYGLALNEDEYIYYYRSIGENLMPDIRVFSLKG